MKTSFGDVIGDRTLRGAKMFRKCLEIVWQAGVAATRSPLRDLFRLPSEMRRGGSHG